MANSTPDRDAVYERETAFWGQDKIRSRESLEFLYTGYGLSQARNQLYQFASGFEGKHVLEIGSGSGSNCLHMAVQGASVIGIELAKQRVAQANRLLAHHIPKDQAIAIPMSAERLGFMDNSFEIVTGVAILHHLDLVQALPEIRRVLKPNGVGIFLEARGGNPLINLYRVFTPSQRTPDEHPLVEADFKMIRSYFGQVDVVSYYFTALLSFLVRKIWKNDVGFVVLNKFLTSLDRRLIRLFPFLERLCWIVVIRASKVK